MSQTDQFWHYAKEAMVAALTPKRPVCRVCLTLPRPGRKRRYKSDSPLINHNRLPGAVPRKAASAGSLASSSARFIKSAATSSDV